jgi:hypothetical protein
MSSLSLTSSTPPRATQAATGCGAQNHLTRLTTPSAVSRRRITFTRSPCDRTDENAAAQPTCGHGGSGPDRQILLAHASGLADQFRKAAMQHPKPHHSPSCPRQPGDLRGSHPAHQFTDANYGRQTPSAVC